MKYAFPKHNRPAALLLALLLMFGSLCACAAGDAVVPESSSVVSISSAVDPEPPVPQAAAPGIHAGMLDGKKIIFVGCSYTYYGGVVIQDAYSVHSQEERANDQGYFYQLCKANGAEVSVMDWCYGGHDLSDLFDGHCDANQTELGYDHLADLTDRYYDYVVLQEIQVPEDWTAEQYRDNVVGIMDVFRAANPDTRFFYVIHNGVTGSYPTAWKESVKLIEEAGAVLVDWGNLVWDLRKGNVDVPGSDTVFRKNSFVVSQSKADGYHPNLLSGYLSALMTYCAITGETAVGQPVSFYNDASADPYFDVEKFLEKYYSWDNPATSEDERATNFVEIFESEADLKGLQMLADAYLDMECKFHTEYKVTFREPDGRIIKSLSYRYGDKVKAPAMTEETFIGWKKTENPDTGELVYTAIYRKP